MQLGKDAVRMSLLIGAIPRTGVSLKLSFFALNSANSVLVFPISMQLKKVL